MRRHHELAAEPPFQALHSRRLSPAICGHRLLRPARVFSISTCTLQNTPSSHGRTSGQEARRWRSLARGHSARQRVAGRSWMDTHTPPFLTEPFGSLHGRHSPSVAWNSHSPSEALAVQSVSRAIACESGRDVRQGSVDITCSAGGTPGEGGKSRQREFQISKTWPYNQQSSHPAKLGSGMTDKPLAMIEENMIFTNSDSLEQKPAVILFCPEKMLTFCQDQRDHQKNGG